MIWLTAGLWLSDGHVCSLGHRKVRMCSDSSYSWMLVGTGLCSLCKADQTQIW